MPPSDPSWRQQPAIPSIAGYAGHTAHSILDFEYFGGERTLKAIPWCLINALTVQVSSGTQIIAIRLIRSYAGFHSGRDLSYAVPYHRSLPRHISETLGRFQSGEVS
jgi:hypothetical protein